MIEAPLNARAQEGPDRWNLEHGRRARDPTSTQPTARARPRCPLYLEGLRSELRQRGIIVTTVFPRVCAKPLLHEINGMMGADMSGGKAFTSNAAAGRIMKGIERRRSYVYFPARPGLSVRLSRFMPPRMYDRIMGRLFSRFPISWRRRAVSGEPPVGG